MKIAILSLMLALLFACGRSPEPTPVAPPADSATAAPEVALPAAAPPAVQAASEAPAETAPGLPAAERTAAFLSAYQAQMFRGLPNAAQADALAEHLSPRLNGLLRDALAGQQAYKSKYPTDKPPMIDGDIFSSLFEGASSGTVESVEESGDTAAVRVKYVYAEPDTGKVIQSWPDRFLLVRAGDGWLIDDVEYLGGWDFAPRGKLSAALVETAALRD